MSYYVVKSNDFKQPSY